MIAAAIILRALTRAKGLMLIILTKRPEVLKRMEAKARIRMARGRVK
jgi:hypothetical protein